MSLLEKIMEAQADIYRYLRACVDQHLQAAVEYKIKGSQ